MDYINYAENDAYISVTDLEYIRNLNKKDNTTNKLIAQKPLDDNELEYLEQKLEGENPQKNCEGYSDPTPHEAIKRIDEKTAAYYRFKKLLRTIWHICALAGFKVEGRIVLRDMKTGRVWR